MRYLMCMWWFWVLFREWGPIQPQWKRWGRCGYLPAVKYPGWYLCPSGEFSVHVGDHDETLWRVWRYLSCVSCICTVGSGVCLCLLLDVQGHGSSWGSFLCPVLVCASMWDAWSSACIILSVCLCSSIWWCHLQCVRGPWLVILIGSVSYLIFSDKMSSLVFVACLSVVFLVLPLLCG